MVWNLNGLIGAAFGFRKPDDSVGTGPHEVLKIHRRSLGPTEDAVQERRDERVVSQSRFLVYVDAGQHLRRLVPRKDG